MMAARAVLDASEWDWDFNGLEKSDAINGLDRWPFVDDDDEANEALVTDLALGRANERLLRSQ